MAGDPLRRERKTMRPVLRAAANHCSLQFLIRHIGCGYAEDFAQGHHPSLFLSFLDEVCSAVGLF